MNKKTIIHGSGDIILKLKILAKEKEGVRKKLAITAKELAVTAKKLGEREEKLKIIFRILPVGIAVLDVESKVVYDNHALESILGMTKEGLFRGDYKKRTYLRSDGSIMVPAEEFASARAIKEQREVNNVETGVVKEDGSIVWVSVNAIPVKFPDWKMLVVSMDITERKKVEQNLIAKAKQLAVIAEEKEDVRKKLAVTAEKLKESQDELARKEKLATLGKLAGIMGHEIRNPLGVIRNSIYFLTMKFGESTDEKVKRHMDIIQSEIDGCDKIISDVLDFARIKPPSIAETEINSVVKASLSKASIPKTVKVQTNLGGNLPKLNIDRAQIQQVFFNIISNAIEAMPKGGELQVTTSQTDTFISIAFKDTGVGIPKENISKLFEPLFSTKPKGLGLGLAACQNIIVLHQGKIEFKSQEGQGATFIVTLPIKLI